MHRNVSDCSMIMAESPEKDAVVHASNRHHFAWIQGKEMSSWKKKRLSNLIIHEL